MRALLLALLAAPVPAIAQDHTMHDMAVHAPTPAPTSAPVPAPAQQHDHSTMAGMDHTMPAACPTMRSTSSSGTALLPAAGGGMTGAHLMTGEWMLMAHGYVWGAYTDQSAARGDDLAMVQSMAMLTAERPIGERAHLQLRSMFSLEPLMGRRGYPSLLATGETANGVPLVDRQHPHDLFMELAARVDFDVASDTSVFLYGGPVGEPALGPATFMHRASARYLPLAPIGHHWFDSSHITYGVVTAGVRHGQVQLEGSAFRGAEPDEQRWDIETPKLDSWSLRASWAPSPNWVAQVSHGRLHRPEAQHPGQNEARTTASIHYDNGRVAAMAAWSAKNRLPGTTLIAWLAEATWRIDRHHAFFGRAETMGNDELFPDHDDPRHDSKYRVARGEAGYAYRVPLSDAAELALGGSLLATAVPDAIRDIYRPGTGYTVFARLALGQ